MNPYRAPFHHRIVAELSQTRKARYNVLSYFVRGTSPRKMSFTPRELRITLKKIRTVAVQKGNNSIIGILGVDPRKFGAIKNHTSRILLLLLPVHRPFRFLVHQVLVLPKLPFANRSSDAFYPPLFDCARSSDVEMIHMIIMEVIVN